MAYTSLEVISAREDTTSMTCSTLTQIREGGPEFKPPVSSQALELITPWYSTMDQYMSLLDMMAEQDTMTFGDAPLRIRNTNGSKFKQQEHSL